MKRFIPIKCYISIVKDKLKEELKCYNKIGRAHV